MPEGVLAKKLENLPKNPGVYIFQNKYGKVVYVGKAKNLRLRIRSYFQKGRFEGPKLAALVKTIGDVEYIITDSESEAFILEANMVKEYKPRYNINLKDDKSFPYIRVTHEEFPRIFPTRKVIRDGSKYFGPYTDVHSMRGLLKAVRRIFPIRSCNYRLDKETVKKRKVRLCLDFHIHRCLGPCEALINEADYQKIIDHTVAFIEGRDSKVIKQLQEEMKNAADLKEFEKAARIRDQVKAIEIFRARQKIVANDNIDRDVVGIASEDNTGCGIIFKVREGKIIGRSHFYLSRYLEQPSQKILHAFLLQYYHKVDFIPREIFIPEEVDDPNEFESWLSKKREAKVSIIVPKKGEKAKLVRLAVRNAKLLLGELKLQKMKEKEEKIAAPVSALQEALSLPKLPKRIEAFDISNIAGTDPVASMVCFINGKPSKSNYRHFKIRSVAGINDFAMIQEVVFRRYRRQLKEKAELPDLILIDGGKGQLRSALTSLEELGLDEQPIISLAKKLEEVFIPDFPDAQNIPKSSPAIKLLQQIRDESHRFAVTFHRTLRTKRQTMSEIDQIPGVGPKRRKLLIDYFGSVRGLREANLDELKSVTGIPTSVAEKLHKHFNNGHKNV